jgi:hypothetical protein
MPKSSIKTALVFLLILTTTLYQVLPSLASAQKDKLRVAFLGIKFVNVPQETQDSLLWRITAMLESEKSFVLTKPDAFRITYGREKLAELVEKQDPQSFLEFARQFQFDHVFSGFLTNDSSDENRPFLVGELNRYDLRTGHVNTYKIRQDYDKIGDDLVRFREQYVKALSIAKNPQRNPWSIVLVAGIVVAAVIAFSSLGGGGGQGESGETPPTDE